MKLLIMGPQGSGKGTQAEKISSLYKIPTISTGDLFREEIASGSSLGKKIKAIIDKGGLAPDDITINVLRNRLNNDDCKKGYILDGFPRTIEQAKLLENFANIDKVIYLSLKDSFVIERISGRRSCPKCHHVHNINFPGDPVHCAMCGTNYIVRDDDKPEAIQKRLETFHQKTEPILDFYKQSGKVVVIDASANPDEVYNQILKNLNISKGKDK